VRYNGEMAWAFYDRADSRVSSDWSLKTWRDIYQNGAVSEVTR